jgi:hypothetical protein
MRMVITDSACVESDVDINDLISEPLNHHGSLLQDDEIGSSSHIY